MPTYTSNHTHPNNHHNHHHLRAELVKQGSAGSYLSWQSESLQEGESSAAAFR